MPDTITVDHTVAIEDVEYQKGMLARLYRPSGAGPFPAALQVHGGAWTSKDRTDNDFMAKALAEGGIFVASIDFRMPPVAPHPGSMQDINLGILDSDGVVGGERIRHGFLPKLMGQSRASAPRLPPDLAIAVPSC